MSCVHNWDFDTAHGFSAYFKCRKCGMLLDGVGAINHMTMLENDLANTREVWNECESQLAESEAMAGRLVDALEELIDGFEIRDDAKLNGLVAEYQASKKESVE